MKLIKKIASVLTATILFVVSMVSGMTLTVGAETTGTYENLRYVAYDDYVEITNCYSSATNVIIPSEINGLPVTSIGYMAFSYCESLTKVIIPNSVTNIGGYAFSNTPWLKAKQKENPLVIVNNILIDGATCSGNVVIPEGVTSIGEQAFSYCRSLTSIIIPESVTSIGREAFSYCRSLTSIIIPESVTSIGSFAFSGTPWLKAKQTENPLVIVNNILIDGTTCSGNVVIPESVTSIGDWAFYSCESLTEVIIPESVTSIGDGAFYYCESLTAINVLPDNLNYCSIDGVLYNKDATTLIYCPGGTSSIEIPKGVTSIGDEAFYYCESLTEVKIPESVTSIGDQAFRSCSSLSEVIIPNSVTSIGEQAFSYCRSLTSIIIPESVTSIGNYAFFYCDNLSDVYFDGTKKEWDKITIGSNNECLTNATMHFYDITFLRGDVDGNGKLNLQDAVDISLYNMNMITFTEEQIEIADYNSDGKVGLIDVVGVATAILPSNK